MLFNSQFFFDSRLDHHKRNEAFGDDSELFFNFHNTI